MGEEAGSRKIRLQGRNVESMTICCCAHCRREASQAWSYPNSVWNQSLDMYVSVSTLVFPFLYRHPTYKQVVLDPNGTRSLVLDVRCNGLVETSANQGGFDKGSLQTHSCAYTKTPPDLRGSNDQRRLLSSAY